MKKCMWMHLLIVCALMLLPTYGYARTFEYGDTQTLGNDDWFIDSDGDILPATDSDQDIGESGDEIAAIYVDAITLGGTEKTSWGSVVSPMTDATGYVYPTDSGGVTRLYDIGYINLGAGTAVDCYLLLDTDDDDWYIGRDDTDNDFAIGVGSTLGTDERISIVDDATSTVVVIGDGVNTEDKQITIDGAECDFYIAYDDSADDLLFGVDATVGSKPCFSIQDESTPVLYLHNGLDGFGAVDIDYGSVDVLDHTFVSAGGTLVIDGDLTLTGSEWISNYTDDTVRVQSNDLDTIFEVYTPYDTTGDATLKLSADMGDAVKEQWTITSTGDGNDLVIGCDTGSSGTPVTQLTLADGGVLTTIAAINAEIDNASNTSITDALNVQHFTSGTAAAGIGVGLTFDLENATGTEEEHASIDVVSAVATNGSEDTDIVVNLMTNGALAEVFRIDNDNEAAAGAVFEFTSYTEETNGVIDMIEIELDNSADTATDDFGVGISIVMEQEDSGTPIQQASVDFIMAESTTATEDCDVVVSQATAGAVAETFRIVANSSATTGDYLKITQNTTETDAVLDALVLTNVTGTAAAGAGIGISFQPEDAGGAEEQASIDVALTTATDSSEDADVIISQNTSGTIVETMRLIAAQSATDCNKLRVISNSTETNGVVDGLQLDLTTSGTPIAGLGYGISIRMNDEGGKEEQASIDTVFTTATAAGEDVDMKISTQTAGAIVERLMIDGDGFPLIVKGGTGCVDRGVLIDGAAADMRLVIDDTGGVAEDVFAIGVGATVGTDVRFAIDSSATCTNLTVGDAANGEDKIIHIPGDAVNFNISYDDSADDLVLGVGLLPGTTPGLTIDGADASASIGAPTIGYASGAGDFAVESDIEIDGDLYLAGDITISTAMTVAAAGSSVTTYIVVHDEAGNAYTIAAIRL